jgi:hypothetical protein
MGTKSRTFEATVELGEVEVEVTVEYHYSPGSPGKTYGPPENCYPPEEAEAEVEQVYLTSDETKTDIMPQLTAAVIEMLFEQACEAGEDDDADAYERAMEDKADAAREREWDP